MKKEIKNPRRIASTWRIIGQTTTSVIQWMEARRLRKIEVIKDNQERLKRKGKRYQH